MIRTRNFGARSGRIETGVLVKSQGEKSALWGENAISGKQFDSLQEETLVVSATDPIEDSTIVFSCSNSADTDWRKKTLERLWSQRREFFWMERPESVIIKVRGPTMRHVPRTHRVALDWLLDRINLDTQNPNQICWHQKPTCGHYLSNRKQSTMSKRGKEDRRRRRRTCSAKLVKSTPQKNRFRDVKYARIWNADWVDDHSDKNTIDDTKHKINTKHNTKPNNVCSDLKHWGDTWACA